MNRIFRFIDPYILLMLLTVGLSAIFPAHGASAKVADVAADAGIVFLFFLYGVRLSPQAAVSGIMQWRLQLAVLLCTFVIFPMLGTVLTKAVEGSLPQPLVTGLLFLCLMPSTVQSSIAFTSIARGNVPAALCAASASNILGVFISPLLAGWLLTTRGVVLSFDIFRDISLQLLAPFLIGQMLRPWIGGWVQAHRHVLGYTDRGSILLIIYVAFSKGVVDRVWSQVNAVDLVELIGVSAALLAVILIITRLIARRLMHLSIEDEIVLQFCGSKKALSSGLPMASILFSGPQLGLVVLPLMLFHQTQLIVCAVLAKRFAMRKAAD
ncbi:bile acid:sodium symporter family protein [Sphingomonas sp. TX0543]|uniref:bile acid:sodium symporter family protein n=1 Tax=Sphingomonas sp. TX0543 TaxID=3399682 RepID=UPI003AFB4C93